MKALEVEKLNISFGDKKVLSDLSFSVDEHKIFGFLGKNGAGKTTTMKIVLGLLKSDSGSVKVFGNEVSYGETKTNKLIGYLPDVPEYYGYMNCTEYLTLCANITEIPKNQINQRIEKYLKLVGLFECKNKRISGFSRGMKQRLGIAQALLNEPKLLICDEPTSALDPIGRKEILDIIEKVKTTSTVVFSTHILSDVESICDDIAILDGGKIVLSGNLEEIKQEKALQQLQIVFENADDTKKFLNSISISNIICNGNEILVSINNETEKKEIFKMLYSQSIIPTKFEIYEPSLEKVFMEVVK